MQSLAAPSSRSKSPLPAIGLTLAASAALLGLVVALHLGGGIPIADLIRDPAAITQTPPYTGLLSQVGLFLWAATAAICLFCAGVASRDPADAAMASFFRASAALTLMLGLDDAFLLHEDLLPRIGIPEKGVLLAYAVLTALYLLGFLRTILARTGYELLAMALFFFAASVVLDVLNPPSIPYLAEDAAKIAGIVSWLAYFSRTAAGTLRMDITAPQPGQARHSTARTTGGLAGGTVAFKSGKAPLPSSRREGD
ncbi:hypothetical protein [Caldimonas tepidiphila]|uniref:hypothetical protein n=1 Tax=Caldimonas tepidiphila TaxID=2315841 RepID=UPI00196A6AF6|nr:hypothetical protein [Caldimonas tepidiphila]